MCIAPSSGICKHWFQQSVWACSVLSQNFGYIIGQSSLKLCKLHAIQASMQVNLQFLNEFYCSGLEIQSKCSLKIFRPVGPAFWKYGQVQLKKVLTLGLLPVTNYKERPTHFSISYVFWIKIQSNSL